MCQMLTDRIYPVYGLWIYTIRIYTNRHFLCFFHHLNWLMYSDVTLAFVFVFIIKSACYFYCNGMHCWLRIHCWLFQKMLKYSAHKIFVNRWTLNNWLWDLLKGFIRMILTNTQILKKFKRKIYSNFAYIWLHKC